MMCGIATKEDAIAGQPALSSNNAYDAYFFVDLMILQFYRLDDVTGGYDTYRYIYKC
jgi:hypothetical protein